MRAIVVAMKRFLAGTVVACLLTPWVAAADSSSVWAIGLPHGYIVMEHQAKRIEVTSEHVAQGFVPVTDATRFVVTTRAQADYALHFALRGSLFRSVQIEGIGRAVEFGPRGGTVVEHDAPAGRSVVAVNYRFHLAPGTVPGSYPWPLEIVARRALPEGFAAASPAPGLVTLSERVRY